MSERSAGLRSGEMPNVMVTRPDVPAPPPAQPAAPPPGAPASIPWLGLVGVLLGTFISTLNTRLSSFGLADIRGAVHAGFDDGAWITTAQTAAQMLVCPIAIWMGTAFGPRKVLVEAAVAFAVIMLIEPFAPNLPMALSLQFAGGLASGFFVPLTLSYVLRNMPPKYWAYGIALYALNLEISLNISASFEGWYVDNLSWRWIFWQQVPLAIGMAACLGLGAPPDPANPQPPKPDYFGFASGGLGMGLIYAALDQGNRLIGRIFRPDLGPDHCRTGAATGLLHPRSALGATGCESEDRVRSAPAAAAHYDCLPAPHHPLHRVRDPAVPAGGARLSRHWRSVKPLAWIAAPQLLICLTAGYLLRRLDPRLVASFGFICICIACMTVAHTLTPLWGLDQFLPSQLLQAVGQSFALSGIVFFAVLHLRPQDALTFASAIQVSRLMGGEMGTAFVTTFVRKSGQVASNLLGQHIQVGDVDVLQRIQAYAAATARAGSSANAAIRGEAVLNNVVHSLSITQAIIDTFVVMSAATAIVLIIIVTRRAAPPHPPVTCRSSRLARSLHRGYWIMALATALTGFSGCAVGPDYKAPKPVEGAETPLVSTLPTVESVAEPPDDWWQLYHDPMLDGLLHEAFGANTDLRIAAANLSASRAVLQATRSQNWPQTQDAVGAVYGRDATTDEILELTGRDPESLWLYEGVLQVAYEVDLFGRVRRSIESARADDAAVEATRDVVKIAVAAETVRAYAQVCALGEQLNVAHRSLDVVTHEATITTNRNEAGAGSKFDVVRAQELVAQVHAAIPPLEGLRQSALFQLAAVLGRPPSKAPAEVMSCAKPPRLSDLIPVGDGATLLKRRPDVRQAERRLAAATARIGVATAGICIRASSCAA